MSKSNLPDIDNCIVAIIGLGYVGLPLAIALAKKKRCFVTKKQLKRDIIGFDTNIQRVEELNKGLDRNKIFKKSYFNGINKEELKVLMDFPIGYIKFNVASNIWYNSQSSFTKTINKLIKKGYDI